MSVFVTGQSSSHAAILMALALVAAPPALAQTPPAPASQNTGRSAPILPAPPSSGLYDPGEAFRAMADPVLADVDGTAITLSEMGDAMRDLPATLKRQPFSQLYPLLLDHLIQERALAMAARRDHLDRDPAVKRRMQEATNQVLRTELLNRMLDKTATEEALLHRYRQDYADKPGPEEVHTYVILVPTEEQARSIIKEIAGGADFETIAKRDSTDTTRAKGGDLGFRKQEELEPSVGGAAFVMEPGQVSRYPIHTPAGWFVIKAAERRRTPAPPFAAVREKIKNDIMQTEVVDLARKVTDQAEVHKFNLNGAPLGSEDNEQDNNKQKSN